MAETHVCVDGRTVQPFARRTCPHCFVRPMSVPDHRCPEIGADTLRGAFVAGAKWWEWESTKGTMWASDRDKAWAEAENRYPDNVKER